MRTYISFTAHLRLIYSLLPTHAHLTYCVYSTSHLQLTSTSPYEFATHFQLICSLFATQLHLTIYTSFTPHHVHLQYNSFTPRHLHLQLICTSWTLNIHYPLRTALPRARSDSACRRRCRRRRWRWLARRPLGAKRTARSLRVRKPPLGSDLSHFQAPGRRPREKRL